MTKFRALLATTLILSAAVLDAEVKFTSTWTAPHAKNTTFKGQKIAAVIVSDDLSLRMSGEEALVRELSARGMQGVAAYRVIPQEEAKSPERAKAWFERDGIAAVVILRPLSQTEEKRPAGEVWVSPTYTTFASYYPYSWSAGIVIGRSRSDTIVSVEALVFEVATGSLVWGGVSEARNPESLQGLIADIVKEAAKKIERRFR